MYVSMQMTTMQSFVPLPTDCSALLDALDLMTVTSCIEVLSFSSFFSEDL